MPGTSATRRGNGRPPSRKATMAVGRPAAKPPSRRRSRRKRDLRDRVILFGPLLLVLVGLLAFPIGFALYGSLANVDDFFSLEFLGLDNYQKLLGDLANIAKPALNTLRFVGVYLAGVLLIGLGGALLLNSNFKGRRWFRSALMMPWVIPTVLVALLWRWVFDPNLGGALNGLLEGLGLIENPVTWLGDPGIAPWVVIAAQVWHGFPFTMIMVIAGLQAIPQELYEAASLDGANAIQKFVSVTWPGVRSVFIIVGTLDGLYAFREFATIDVLTKGGPAGETEVLATLVYRMFFEYHHFGEALALAALMFVVALIATTLSMRLSLRGEEN